MVCKLEQLKNQLTKTKVNIRKYLIPLFSSLIVNIAILKEEKQPIFICNCVFKLIK